MKKKNIIISLFVLTLALLMCFSGCGHKKSGKKAFLGTWINCDGDSLIIDSDQTWRTTFSYGSGTWKISESDKSIAVFSDCYGDIEEASVEEDELGEFIHLDYGWGERGTFYKDAYPSEEEISALREKNAVTINPFEGMEYEISGISPCCEIVINNGKCSEEVQNYVKFELDKKSYANGETAVIKAVLSENTGDVAYKLSESEKKISVTGQPEYVDSLTAENTVELKKELNDFVSGNISSALMEAENSWWSEGTVLGNTINLYHGTVKDYNYSDIYLSSLKRNKELSYENNYANKLTFVYSGKYTSENGNGNFYSCVSACNIVKYPDGTIKWGTESNDAKDFLIEPSSESVENAVKTIVMSNSADYNISKVDLNK